MRQARWWWAVVVGSCLAAPAARAQDLIILNPYGQGLVTSSFGYNSAGIGLSLHRRHLGLSISAGGFSSYSSRTYAFSPYLTGPGYLTIVQGGAIGGIIVPPPPLLLQAGAVDAANQEFEARMLDMLTRQKSLLEPQQPKEGTLMVKVERRPEKPAPGAGEKAKPPANADQPPPRREELKPLPGQNLDPRTAVGRLILLGREAFAQAGYGRAVQRFRQAVTADEKSADAHLLLGQALFAIGKYREAVVEVQRGLALNPNWARQPFRPLDMYGADVVDYAVHLGALEDAVADKPNDPDLLFLLGYELWYDGRREEAAGLFRKARRLVPNDPGIPLFLNQVPALPLI